MYQIAQYRTNKKFFNTYIAVDVRNFFKGRNECIRPISEFSKQFAIDFVEGKIKTKQDVNKYLENIMNEHYKRSKDCQACYGINKYMLGIKLAWNENQEIFGAKPKLFDCIAWNTISENRLSTSSIVSPNAAWVYFDPVHVDGIGIFMQRNLNLQDFLSHIESKIQTMQMNLLKTLNEELKSLLNY